MYDEGLNELFHQESTGGKPPHGKQGTVVLIRPGSPRPTFKRRMRKNPPQEVERTKRM